MKSNKPNQCSKSIKITKEKTMKNNQGNTNDTDLPNDFKHALVELCFEFGNEKDSLNVIIKSFLQDLKEQGFQVCSPRDLMFIEGGYDFLAGWAETIGRMRLAQVFGILATIEERLPEGAFLTDLTKVELTKWSNTEEGVNFDLDVSGMFVTEEETNQ